MKEPEPHDAHVELAHKIFRDCGFTIEAMKYKRPPEALIALKRFNGLPDDAKVPFAWNYHPNEWCARVWAETGCLVPPKKSKNWLTPVLNLLSLVNGKRNRR